MRRLIDRCAGIDVGQALLVVCVRVVTEKAKLVEEVRSFGATTPDLADVALGAVVVGRYSPVGAEAEVVVLPIEESVGERVVLAHHLVGPGGGLGGPDLGGRAVELDLGVQGVGIEDVGAGGDGLGHQLLHHHERVGGLLRPAPLALEGARRRRAPELDTISAPSDGQRSR